MRWQIVSWSSWPCGLSVSSGFRMAGALERGTCWAVATSAPARAQAHRPTDRAHCGSGARGGLCPSSPSRRQLAALSLPPSFSRRTSQCPVGNGERDRPARVAPFHRSVVRVLGIQLPAQRRQSRVGRRRGPTRIQHTPASSPDSAVVAPSAVLPPATAEADRADRGPAPRELVRMGLQEGGRLAWRWQQW
jgi:hypothetical protein